jgi:hypothetical protein
LSLRTSKEFLYFRGFFSSLTRRLFQHNRNELFGRSKEIITTHMSKHSAVYATATVAFAGMCLFAISQQGRECITGVKKWMGGTQLQKQEKESLKRIAKRVAVIITWVMVGGMIVGGLRNAFLAILLQVQLHQSVDRWRGCVEIESIWDR